MISIPPGGGNGGSGGVGVPGGTGGHHGRLTIDCSRTTMESGPKGGSRGAFLGSQGSSTVSTPPSSWDEAMSQLSKDLQVICQSPDSNSFLQGPISPKLYSSNSPDPPSPKMVPPPPKSPKYSAAGLPSTSLLDTTSPAFDRPKTPELAKIQNLNVKHQQTEENLRQKLSSIVGRGIPRRSHSVVDYPPKEPAQSQPPKVVRSSPPRKNSTGFTPNFNEIIDVGNRQIEHLHVVIDDRKLLVFVDDKPTLPGTIKKSKSSRDLIKTIEIPDDVVPEKLICIMRDGRLQVRESKSSIHNRSKSTSDQSLRPDSPNRCRTKSDGSQPQASQGPIVIHDDGSQLLKLVLHIPTGYRMQDLIIKTIDDQLIVSGRKAATPSEGAVEEVCSSDKAAVTESTPIQAGQQGLKRLSDMIQNDFMKVFELPNTVDPYSITAHLTERSQLVIQATLSSRGRCGSY